MEYLRLTRGGAAPVSWRNSDKAKNEVAHTSQSWRAGQWTSDIDLAQWR